MRIFFMNNSGLEVWGGGEKWMFQTGVELSARGHRVFFGGRAGSRFLTKCGSAGFKTFSLRNGRNFDPFTIKKLTTFFREQEIQLIVTEQSKDVRLTCLAGKFSSQIVTVARTGLPSIKNTPADRLLYPKLVDSIMVSTQAIRQKYLSYGWLANENIRVIPTGMFPVASPAADTLRVKRQLELPEDRPIIGIFGKLIKKKQHNIFLEVAAKVQEKFSGICFLIVGDGPERKNLQQYAFDLGVLDNLYMTGFLENPLALYSVCDIVLLTSQEEGLPHTVMEAMLMEKPVVAFDVGGVSELIISEKNGILVPPNDIYLMSRQVEMLLTEQERARQLGREARNYILNHFAFKRSIDDIEAYFELLIRQKQGELNGT